MQSELSFVKREMISHDSFIVNFWLFVQVAVCAMSANFLTIGIGDPVIRWLLISLTAITYRFFRSLKALTAYMSTMSVYCASADYCVFCTLVSSMPMYPKVLLISSKSHSSIIIFFFERQYMFLWSIMALETVWRV